jgi:hypothetical protein
LWAVVGRMLIQSLKRRIMILLLLGSAVAAYGQHPPDIPSPATIDAWLHGAEEHLPGWSIHVQSPILTFQMRYAVAIRARADIARAHLTGHDLHVFVRVADPKGWLPIPRHSSLPRLPGKADVMVSENFYATPGDYRVAFIVYDSVARTHGIWFRSVHVPDDALPIKYAHPSEVEFIDAENPFLRYATPVPHPIENAHPLRIDVVVNLTERVELELDRQTALANTARRAPNRLTPDWMLDEPEQDVTSQSLLSVAEAVAAIDPKGCVRVSAFDAIRAKTYLDRRSTINIAHLMEELKLSRNVAQVDQRTLALRQKSAEFFRSFVQRIVDDRTACDDASSALAERAVVIVSDEMMFPKDEPLQSVEPATGNGNIRFYFLRLAIPDFERQSHFDYITGMRLRMASGRFDEVARLLSDLHPRRFDLAQPKDFERALPQLRDLICGCSVTK